MPKKTLVEPTYNDAVFQSFREILKVIDFKDITFVDGLEGEELRDFCKFCFDVYKNPFFQVIISNFIWKQVMLTAAEGLSKEQYDGGKMMCQGIKTVDDFFRFYAGRWENEYEKRQDDFDPRAAFNKPAI